VTTPAKPGEKARRLTDQAMKVLPLRVVCHGATQFTPEILPIIGFDVGMVYAGAVQPAMMTHSAVSMMLENLHPQQDGPRIRTPSFSAVADLVRHVSEEYTRQAAWAYPKTMPPYCEFVIFAQPPTQDLNSEPISAYWIRPESRDATESFTEVIIPVDVMNGEVAVIGTERDALRCEIEQLQERAVPAWMGIEPRIDLERRMRKGDHDTDVRHTHAPARSPMKRKRRPIRICRTQRLPSSADNLTSLRFSSRILQQRPVS
jgi:hypothetical protein